MADASGPDRRLIRFGTFVVDLHTRELREGNVRLRVDGHPFAILALLLERPGELRTRDEIRAALWPADTFVDFEHSINAAIRRLREVLQDSADHPRYIETLPRRGYRFIHPVDYGSAGDASEEAAAPPRSDLRSRWMFAALGMLALGAGVLLTVGNPRHPAPSALPIAPPNSAGEPERPAAEAANAAYLKGKHHLTRGTEDDRQKAAEYFAEAIRLDPGLAPAYSNLALLHAHGGAYLAGGRQEARMKARKWAALAIELDPRDAAAHAALGWLELADWDWQGAGKAFQRAIALDPKLTVARVWYSQYLSAMGRVKEAREQAEEAIRLNPADPVALTHAAIAAYQAGDLDAAMAQWQTAKDLDRHYWGARHFLARAYLHQKLYARALSELEETARLEGSPRIATETLLVYAYARLRRRAEATRLFTNIQERYGNRASPYNMALACIGMHDVDGAFAWLERGYERRGEGLFHLNAEPLFEPLYGDARYKDLLTRMELPRESLPRRWRLAR